MSFDNNYPNRKDWLGKYIRCARTCRTGGSCPWCYGNRIYKVVKKILSTQEKLSEYYNSQRNC